MIHSSWDLEISDPQKHTPLTLADFQPVGIEVDMVKIPKKLNKIKNTVEGIIGNFLIR
jgi:hypothetical protein